MSQPQQPMHGAVDLDSLRRRQASDVSPVDSVLFNMGLKCVCGKEIVEGGIEVIAVFESMVPSEQGGQTLGALVAQKCFCSKNCSLLVQFVQGIPSNDSLRVAVRPMPTIEWWSRDGEPEEAEGDQSSS